MSLLATAGRRSDALRVYQTLATSLEELDVAPDAEIQALRVQLLAQDAAPVAAHFPPRQAQAARLTNLPMALTSFVGRAGEVSEVRDLLGPERDWVCSQQMLTERMRRGRHIPGAGFGRDHGRKALALGHQLGLGGVRRKTFYLFRS